MGTVKNEAQSPLANVEVTLEAGIPYEEAKGPNHRQVLLTGPSGQFEFTYISWDRRLPYRLSFAVSGCSPTILTGLSGEKRQHQVALQACEKR
jgi:hypothetical protein